MLSESIYKYLTDDAGVSALVSTRVFPLVIPQQSYDEVTKQPCLVYTLDTAPRGVTFDGSELLIKGMLQIDCYSRSYSQCQSLSAALRSAMIDLSGTLTDNASPVGSVRVKATFLDGESSLMDPEPGLYRVMHRYTIWYVE